MVAARERRWHQRLSSPIEFKKRSKTNVIREPVVLYLNDTVNVDGPFCLNQRQ